MSVKASLFLSLLLLSQAIVLTHELCRDIWVPHIPERKPGETRLSGVYEKALLWDTNTVTVSFINGNETQRAQVRTVASEWTPHSNIHFNFIDQPYRGDIRVSFYEHLGSMSLVGMDSKHYSIDTSTGNYYEGVYGPSMNLGDHHTRSTILHEFGRKLFFVWTRKS